MRENKFKAAKDHGKTFSRSKLAASFSLIVHLTDNDQSGNSCSHNEHGDIKLEIHLSIFEANIYQLLRVEF